MQYVLTQEEYDDLTSGGIEDKYKEKYEDLTRELETFVMESQIDIFRDAAHLGDEVAMIKISTSKLNGRLLGAFKHRFKQLKR